MISNDAIARLYRELHWPRPGTIPGCPHCVRRDEQSALCQKPLSELSADELGPFAFRALATLGDADAYRHFLPRILELSLIEHADEPGLETWLIREKLELSGFREWPSAALAAIDALLDACWLDALHQDPARRSGADAMQQLAMLKGDNSAWLAAWTSDTSALSLGHLAVSVASCSPNIARDGLAFDLQGSTLSTVRDNAERMAVWLKAPAQRQRLEQAFQSQHAEPLATQIAEALEAYEWL